MSTVETQITQANAKLESLLKLYREPNENDKIFQNNEPLLEDIRDLNRLGDDIGSTHERKTLWASIQRKLLSHGYLVTESEKAEAEEILYLITDRAVKCEFLAKAFLLSIPLRKYLAEHPLKLRELLNQDVEPMALSRYAGAFLGHRYLGDLKMNATERSTFSIQLLVFGSASSEFEFGEQRLKPLQKPFDTPPTPLIDLVNYHKNKKIEDLEAQITGLKAEIAVGVKDKEKVVGEVEHLQKKLRDLENTNKDAALAVIKTKPTQAEMTTKAEIPITFSEKPNGEAGKKTFQLLWREKEHDVKVETVFVASEGPHGTYKISLQPQFLGPYTVKGIRMDGLLLPNSTFEFTAVRDYKLLKTANPTTVVKQYKNTPLGDPWGMAVDKDGNVYVSDCKNQKVYCFSSNFEPQDEMTCVPVDGRAPFPRGVVVSQDLKLAVVGANVGKIQTFSLGRGGSLDSWFGGGIGPGDGQFKTPRGTCLGPEDDIIIVDSDQHRVQVFSKGGEFLRKFGEKGQAPGKLYYPAAVVYNNGELIVTDCDNSRLQVFDYKTGEFKKVIGQQGKEEGQFLGPSGITVDPLGNVLVTDFKSHYVQVFNSNYEFVTRFGGEGKLLGPRGIVVDARGRVWIADMGNNRLVVF